jgi:predicted dehydrogenase
MRDLKIGCIGVGLRSYLLDFAHKPNKGSRVVACCDISEKNLEEAKVRFGSDTITVKDHKDLIRLNLDAIFILTPDYLHEEEAIDVLNAKIPLYLDKPLAITIDGCNKILEAAVANKTKLYLGHNMRHMPFVLKMKELIDSGAIGEVKSCWCRHFVGHGGDYYYKDWHSERKYINGLLLQKACHDIDIIHWLCGGYTNKVNAMGNLSVYNKVANKNSGTERIIPKVNQDNWPAKNQTEMSPVIDVEDLSMMQMELDNGVLASYQQCHYSPDYWRNYTFIGTEGRIENFGDIEEGTVIKLWNKRVNGYSKEADKTYEIEVGTGDHGGSDERIVHEFLEYVRNNSKITTSPVGARYSVAAGCAATESLRSGGIPVEIPELNNVVKDYFI